jgi:hypothetical protein
MVRDLALKEGTVRTPKQGDNRPALAEDVEELIYQFRDEYDLEITNDYAKGGNRYYALGVCPFKGEPHSGDPNKTAIILSPTAVGFRCFSDDCEGKGMRELREHLAQQTGHRSTIQFYAKDEAVIERRFEEWLDEQYKALESAAKFDPWVMYDEATYHAVRDAQTRKGTTG